MYTAGLLDFTINHFTLILMKTYKNEKVINKEKNSSILKLMQPFQKFIQAESFSGFLLLIFTAAALIWANSAFSGTYINLWPSEVTLGFKEFIFTKDLHFYINDVLMSVFFFVVGLEIKRELIDGELSSARKAALPILAAAGGMLFPALIYTAFNFGAESSHGWGIPTATDIAFAIGILSLLGNRVSLGIKVFLTALAIADDMGAVLIIAIFYTAGLIIPWLIAGIAVFGLLLLLNKLNVYSISAYAALGVILWIALYNTGVHPTIAGVLTAAAIPARGKITSDKTAPLVPSPLKRLEDLLHPWVAFFIMPLFALANAGVVLKGDFLSLYLQAYLLQIFFSSFRLQAAALISI